jgi:ArsR family transcriptional regulator, arsenate/arsenite/antimonite-responsive transcriptional repressor
LEILKIFKALADENRLRILNMLNQKELCVCELESILGINQSNASRHLIKLKDSGLIFFEKQAQFVFYKVDPQTVERYPFLKQVLNDELSKNPKFQNDLAKLDEFSKAGKFCDRESGPGCG